MIFFRTLERRGHPFCPRGLLCACMVCTEFSVAPVCIVVQANSNCHAELAELSVLRGERDQLTLALIEARMQLARCNTAWDLTNQQTSHEASHLPKQPTSELAEADDARPPHATLTAQPSPLTNENIKTSRAKLHPRSRAEAAHRDRCNKRNRPSSTAQRQT